MNEIKDITVFNKFIKQIEKKYPDIVAGFQSAEDTFIPDTIGFVAHPANINDKKRVSVLVGIRPPDDIKPCEHFWSWRNLGDIKDLKKRILTLVEKMVNE